MFTVKNLKQINWTVDNAMHLKLLILSSAKSFFYLLTKSCNLLNLRAQMFKCLDVDLFDKFEISMTRQIEGKLEQNENFIAAPRGLSI